MTVSSISASSYSNIRMSGLVTGLDTDSIVEQLISIEQTKVDRYYGKKTIIEWQQEGYREIISKLSALKDDQFNVLDVNKNMLSESGYKSVTLSNAADDVSRYLSVIANGDAINLDHTINKITQIAQASTTESSAVIVGNIESSVDYSTGPINVNGLDMNVSLDGTLRNITFEQDFATLGDLSTYIQTEADSEFGAGRISVSITDGKYLTLEADNSLIQLTSGTNDALDTLGFSNGDQNKLNVSQSLATAFNEVEATVEFDINGESFSFANSESISDVMDEINRSAANVQISYSSLSDKFTLTSTETGASSKIEITNTTGDFFGAGSYINITSTEIQNGQDAVFYLDDEALSNPIYRSKNVFSIDNVTYSLKEATDAAIDIKISDDVDVAYDKIVSFISDYNDTIESIYAKVQEKRYYDYLPLTDAQKEEMSDDDITAWEEKAKAGLLKGDVSITRMADDLRMVAIDFFPGSRNLSEIGVTSMGYLEKGKLTINETTLREALEEDVSSVMDLFNAQSDIEYGTDLTLEQRTERYAESGFATRVYDIMRDNIRITRDDNGNKGILIEIAGKVGDVSVYDNFFKSRIDDMDKRIARAIASMEAKEERYIRQFSALETAILQLNSQSAWLTAQFSE